MKKMQKFAPNIAFGLCVAALCCAPALAAETLRIGGGSAPMENIFKRIKEPFQQKTGIALELVDSGPVDAYAALLEGRLDVASAGVGSLLQWQAMVEKAGVGVATSEKLVWHIVGIDLITMYANKNVALRGDLTADQAKGIFTGRITNWKEVGGPDAPIVVVLGNKVQGLMKEFQEKILGGAAYLQTAEYVDTAADMKAKVIGTPNSVAIGTMAQLEDDRINEIHYPEVERYISMLWRLNSPRRQQVQTLYEYLRSKDALQYSLQGSRQKHEAEHGHGHGHDHDHDHEHK